MRGGWVFTMHASGVLLCCILAAVGTHADRHHHQSKAPKYEVFGFIAADKPDYANYDWNTLTTVAWNTDPQLVDIAHAHGTHTKQRGHN